MENQHHMSYMSNAKNHEFHVNATTLTLLISRLEAATSRLEDIASSAASYEGDAATNGAPPAPTPSSSAKGVPAAAASVAAAGASPTLPPAPPKAELPPMIQEFDTTVLADLKAYEKLSNSPTLGGLVGEQVRLTGGNCPNTSADNIVS
jgi:adenylyl cyclase-associated protein